jgi:hypothetical protein
LSPAGTGGRARPRAAWSVGVAAPVGRGWRMVEKQGVLDPHSRRRSEPAVTPRREEH